MHSPKIVQESYGNHLRFALQLSFDLLVLSVISVVHGLFPWILTGTVSNKIRELNSELKERWLNPK